MKILFSADWHLGYTLMGANPQRRLPDQRRQLDRIAAYVDDHDVDVLAIAGDIFDEASLDGGRARDVVRAFVEPFLPALGRGLRIIGVAGNHDRDWFIEAANGWLSAATPGGDGSIVLRTRPELMTVERTAPPHAGTPRRAPTATTEGGDRETVERPAPPHPGTLSTASPRRPRAPTATGNDVERVNLALLPFPTPSRYELKADEPGALAQRNEQLAKLFVEKMEELRKQAELQRLPTVLLTHVTVSGTDVKAHRISPRDDVVIPRGGFPEFELTVVGHIHKAEQIGSAPFYYAGGLDRMDISERDYTPRVLLADIGADGLRSVTSLRLDPTPFAAVVAADEEAMEAARAKLDRPDETLVKLTLQVAQGTYVGPLHDAARRLFPRLYGNVEHVWVDEQEIEASVTGLDPANVEETIRRYLEEQQMPDDERAALMELVAELRAAPDEAAA